ncbi:MAG: NADH-quinone oxidoreductase subunit I [Pseudomonadota bacterium]
MGYLGEIYTGTASLVSGLAVTIKALFKPVVTVQYPRETIDITPVFRGHIELIADEAGEPKCICCGMCQLNCPSECISLTSIKPAGAKKKMLDSYGLDFTKCSLCGTCVDNCPADAIRHSDDYNLAGFSREDFHFDLLQRLKEQVLQSGPPVKKIEIIAAPEVSAVASEK